MEILEGNKTSFTLTKNPTSQNCIKYIDVIHHQFWGLVDDEKLEIQ